MIEPEDVGEISSFPAFSQVHRPWLGFYVHGLYDVLPRIVATECARNFLPGRPLRELSARCMRQCGRQTGRCVWR